MIEDGNWVTSRQPSDLPAFIRGMIALFHRSAVAATGKSSAQIATAE